jgi:hypothetical protein
MAGHVECIVVMKNAYRLLVQNFKGNTETNVKEKAYIGGERIHRPQDRYQWRALVNTVMNFRFP